MGTANSALKTGKTIEFSKGKLTKGTESKKCLKNKETQICNGEKQEKLKYLHSDKFLRDAPLDNLQNTPNKIIIEEINTINVEKTRKKEITDVDNSFLTPPSLLAPTPPPLPSFSPSIPKVFENLRKAIPYEERKCSLDKKDGSNQAGLTFLFEKDILPQIPDECERHGSDYCVKNKGKSCDYLIELKSRLSTHRDKTKSDNCVTYASTISDENLWDASIQVHCFDSKASTIKSPNENPSERSIPSFTTARKKFEHSKKTQLPSNDAVFRQLEDLGLGFVQDGEWIPTDVISRTIWTNISDSKSWSAKWNHKSKKFTEPKSYDVK